MTAIPASLRRLVIERSENRCEYCKISQIGQVATFHIDHVVPVAAGGLTTPDKIIWLSHVFHAHFVKVLDKS